MSGGARTIGGNVIESRPARDGRDVRAATTLSDEDVVERVCGGEVQLFELLMRRYNQRVYRTARAVLRDDGEAEESVQETWVSAYTSLASFAGRARFATWLTRIALNHAIERDRRRRRTFALADPPSDSSCSAEQQTLHDELRHALESAVSELPEVYRTTFMLRAVEGLSTAETAACQDIAEETVRTRLHRARELLRHDIEARFGARLQDCFTFGTARCDRMVAVVLSRAAATSVLPEERSRCLTTAPADVRAR
jgi:RNA polymerase sigma-70 factor (ECF subfamily)